MEKYLDQILRLALNVVLLVVAEYIQTARDNA